MRGSDRRMNLRRLISTLILSVGLLVSYAGADTLRLADGTVLTGEVRLVTDSIIEVKTDGKVRFISLNKVHPEDRARFEKQADPPDGAAEAPGTPGGDTLPGTSDSAGIPTPPAAAEAAAQDVPWDGETLDVPILTRTAFSVDTAQATRVKAAEALHRLGYDGPVDPLIEQFGSTDEMVAAQALQVMRKMPSLRMLEPILARFTEYRWQDKENVRWFGEILAAMGDSAVPRIIEVSQQSDYRKGYDLITVMGFLDDPRITTHLVQLVEQMESGYPREEAFDSLARIGTPEAVEAIIGPLCQAVENDTSDNLDCMWAIGTLGELGDKRGVEPLIHALKRESEPSGSQYAIAEALVKIKDPRALGPLIGKLRSSNMEMRHLAAEALGGLGDPAAIKPLMSLMVYLDEDLRMTAAEGIGMIGDLRTAGVLIGYLDACPGDENTYEPLVGLGEMGGKRVYRAIQQRMSREPADGMTEYHGQQALDKIDSAGTAEAEVSAGETSLWHFSCWLGFLVRWLLIAIIWYRLIVNPARDAEDQTARKPSWFERFVLLTLAGLCVVRLLYVLIFHLNPGVLTLVVSTGMPLGRYVLCAVMDLLVVLLAVRGAWRRRPWGWPLLLAYLPIAALLSLYDYGYWTMVMLVGAFGGLVALGAWLLGERLSLRPVTSETRVEQVVIEHPWFTRPFLTALVLLNSARLLIAVAASVLFLGFTMTWGWDAFTILLGVLAAAIAGVADAALVYLVNKLLLMLFCRARRGPTWVERTIDGVSGLVLAGLCILAFGACVGSGVEESENIPEMILSSAAPLLLIGIISIYPVLQVWRNREQRILRYYVIATIVAYFLAQPLAWLWITKLQ